MSNQNCPWCGSRIFESDRNCPCCGGVIPIEIIEKTIIMGYGEYIKQIEEIKPAEYFSVKEKLEREIKEIQYMSIRLSPKDYEIYAKHRNLDILKRELLNINS